MNTKKSKVRLWSVLTALTAILTIAAADQRPACFWL